MSIIVVDVWTFQIEDKNGHSDVDVDVHVHV
jgi:hypothetical protein